MAKYFDGDTLNLDRLAKDGIFAPNMTLEQVKLAAKVWAKKNSKFNPLANDKSEAKKRVEEYLELYGKYAKGNANLMIIFIWHKMVNNEIIILLRKVIRAFFAECGFGLYEYITITYDKLEVETIYFFFGVRDGQDIIEDEYGNDA